MKSVLLSIKPKYCELIASGEKTVEIRKNRPKIDTPFKCYIYCTKETELWVAVKNGQALEQGDSKVIGEFVCDEIEMWNEDECLEINPMTGHSYLCEMSCVLWRELKQYWGDSENIYAWHISDLVIYDKPKKLSEFRLKRPPQSWCYVEELEA